MTIGGAGLVTKVETGTVNSQSDSDWAAFSALQAVETAYEVKGKLRRIFTAGPHRIESPACTG